jgi:cytochrome c2
MADPMRKPSPSMSASRLYRLVVATASAAALVVVASGCDLQENADVDNGRQLFTEKCGTCHKLAETGTQADIGPDLDASFKASRAAGMDQDTIEGVVEAQIANPRLTDPDDPTFMPADLVTGQDAVDVAAYVARFAGVPGIKPKIDPDAGPGAQVFVSQGCGSCHTLAAAGSSGTAGPNLDEVLKGQSAAQVMKSITDPDADIAAGFSAGVMPDTYADLPAKELKDLVDFLIESVTGAS